MEKIRMRRVKGGEKGNSGNATPENLRAAQELAHLIERAVHLETGRGVADLTVEVSPQGVLLRGRCDTYYTKQLAQHAAMQIPGGDRLINSIEVS